MKRKSVIRLAALFLALVLLTAAFSSCGETRRVRANARASRTVATAGNLKIPYENYYYLAMTRRAELESDGVTNEAVLRETLSAFVDENLLTRSEALISLGYDYGLDVEKGDLNDAVAEEWLAILENDFDGDRKEYIASLDAEYLTDSYVRRYIGVENYLPSAIVREMMTRGEFDTSDDAARALIEGDAFVRTVHVFVKKNNGLYTEEENRAHIEEIAARVTAKEDATERYTEMRKAIGGKYNNDYADTIGNGYYFTRGEMDAAYEAAAFGLPEYGVSEVVETKDGFFLIMRLPKEAAYIEENFEVLKNKAYFVTLNEKVDARLAELTLKKTKFGASLDVLSLPAVRAGGGEALPYIVGGAVGVAVIALIVALFRLYRPKRALRGGKKRKQ